MRKPGEKYESPLLGPQREPYYDEAVEIEALVREVPIAVFQKLSEAFNDKGLRLEIGFTERPTH